MNNQFYATVINRLYYACFHATKVLWLTKDIASKTHSGVVHILHLHFVQTGLFDMQQASFYSSIMQERMEEDYSDEIKEDRDTAIEFTALTKKYLVYVNQKIKLQVDGEC